MIHKQLRQVPHMKPKSMTDWSRVRIVIVLQDSLASPSHMVDIGTFIDEQFYHLQAVIISDFVRHHPKKVGQQLTELCLCQMPMS
ncbi:hypothetical protein BV898_09845 [Hypsibius exemplaris]|uniref:Uncharacterized protein n=1 Tax=Hypsibius exemplaris TaxID=2072580 RepID=A0A1W0WLJ7_HYPEX|nr:hypothetical protein BV898_09845 [Hypsibius exemplaris]